MERQFAVPSAEQRERAWGVWDVDGDGELSFGELHRAISLTFPELNDPDLLQRAFKAADNGDGRISRREFRLVLDYIAFFKRMQAKFAELDADSSGTLSLPEFARASAAIGLRTRGGIPFTPESARAHFKAMDTDGSGSIDFDEFAVWAVRYQVRVRFSLPLISAQQI